MTEKCHMVVLKITETNGECEDYLIWEYCWTTDTTLLRTWETIRSILPKEKKKFSHIIVAFLSWIYTATSKWPCLIESLAEWVYFLVQFKWLIADLAVYIHRTRETICVQALTPKLDVNKATSVKRGAVTTQIIHKYNMSVSLARAYSFHHRFKPLH